MAIYIGKTWMCESCNSWVKDEPWNCPVCDEEVCETCFHSYMVCCKCAEGKTVEEVKAISEKLGYEWDE